MPRSLEIGLALFCLFLLSPVFLFIALAIKISGGGRVFYYARRSGRNGREFMLVKFRSMVPGADKSGGALTTRNDGRVTRLGAFLRRYKLDELPQLLNVLSGDMSLVGPRPEDPRYVSLYNTKQVQLLKDRPGITSPASIQFRNEQQLLGAEDWEKYYINEILPRKLAVELAYQRGRTAWSDVRVILQTIGVIGR